MSETNPAPRPRLVTVGRLLERGVDLDAILAALVDEVAGHLDADRGTLYLLDPGRRQLFSKAAHLPELAEIRLEWGQGIAGDAAAQDALVSVPDAYTDPRFDQGVDERTGYRTRGVLAAPIHDAEGSLLGVLQVLNKRSGAFDAADAEAMLALATQVGGVLEKTSLYAELRPRAGADPARYVDYRYNFIVGTSAAMRQVYELVDKAATTDATVMLQGESGTGKGLIARAIHRNSARRDGPFVTVDCTSLPPTLIESALFGHERGAFTGADRRVVGKIEAASGGTLFLDEIGELPLVLQGKLLRVIQERAFERVGGTETLQADFRLLAATHRNLDAMVEEGTFRADLYYRIRVVPILLPPLRERGASDLERLAEHFVAAFAHKHHRPARTLSAKARERLLAHSWPGNIRELENCIESAVVLSDGEVIDVAALSLPSRPTRRGGKELDLSRTLVEVERDYVATVLADCGGNQSEAARRLGIGRNTLARKLGREG